MATTVAELMVRIGADTSELQKQFNQINREFKPLSQSLNRIGNSLTRNLTLPIAGAAAGLLLAAGRTANYADEIDKMAVRTGLSRTQLQELRFATDQLGVSFSSVQSVIESFTRRLPGMEKGTSDSAKAIEQLGVQLRDNQGQMRGMDKIFNETLLSLSRMENTTQRNALATQIFGRRFFEILPLLDAGEEGIRELTERAHELGLVMSDDSIAAAVEYKDAMGELKQEFSAIGRDIMMKFIPVLKNDVLPIVRGDMIPLFKSFAENVGTLTQAWGDLSDSTQKATIYMLGFAAAAGPVFKILAGLVKISGAVKAGAVALGATGAALVGIPVAAVTGAEALKRYLRNSENVTEETKKLLDEFKRLNPELYGFIRSTDEAARVTYGFIRSTDEAAGAGADIGKIYGNYADKIDELNEQYKELIHSQEPLTGERLREAQSLRLQIELLERELELRKRLTQSVEGMTNAGIELSALYQGLPTVLEKVSDKNKDIVSGVNNLSIAIADMMMQWRATFEQAAHMFMFWASHGKRSTSEFLQQFRNMTTQIISMELAKTVAAAVRSVFQTVPFPLNIGLAGGIGAAAGALFQSAIPSFGKGAFVQGDTLAIVGDHPQGEYVIPAPNLENIVGAGNQVRYIEGRIHMDELVIAVADQLQQRGETT